MIRPAKYADVIRISELISEMHAKSKYVGISEMDEDAARKLVAQCVQRHGGQHDGGTLVMVAEQHGVVHGFMIGILDRIYHVTQMLAANDLFLYCSEGASPTDMAKLFAAYMDWAQNNPKVAEIRASWTDAVDGAERMASFYERKNFDKIGEIYSKLGRHE